MALGIFVLLALVVIGVLWYISVYNGLIRRKTMVDEAWSGIDVQLKRRYDLIPNLVETVKGYAKHEDGIFRDLARMRGEAMSASGVQAKSKAEESLSQGLRGLLAVAEAYPELKANTNFLDLQQNLAGIEEQLQLARRYYNGTVRDYNIAVQSFPSALVAARMGYAKADYFELENAAEREAPSVKF